MYVPDPSPVVERHRDDARRMLGVRGLPIDTSPFAFLPVLQARSRRTSASRSRATATSRAPAGGCRSSERRLPFPIGPFRIAQASGAPIFPVFVLQEGDGTVPDDRRGGDPGAERAGRRGATTAVVAALATFVASMERTIREYPTQWYLFTRFWEPAA